MKKKKNQTEISNENMTEVSAPATSGKKKKRKKAPVIIAILVVVFLVFRLVSCAMTPEATTIVTTAAPVRGDLQENISTSGNVISGEKRVYFAPVNGTLGAVNIAAGDAVKSGDLLVSYDMDKMERSMQEAQLQQEKSQAGYSGTMADNSENTAKLTEANTNLNVLNQQIADQKAYLKRLQEEKDSSLRGTQKRLAEDSNSIAEEMEEQQKKLAGLTPGTKEYLDTQARIEGLEKSRVQNSNQQSTYSSSDYIVDLEKAIADSQENLNELEEYKAKMESQKNSSEATVLNGYEKQQYAAEKELAALSYEEASQNYQTAQKGIIAAFDGIVTECMAVQGNLVAEGAQLLTLESSSNVQVAFQATKNDIEKLALGQKAEVTIAGHSYEGEISKINRMATVNASNTPMVGVEVHITNPDEHIILGLDAKLNVQTDETKNALLIPVEAINADKDGDFLYVVENGIAVRRPVVCGISSDEYTEIIEGLTEEDQIILSSYTDLTEGMAVTAVPEQ